MREAGREVSWVQSLLFYCSWGSGWRCSIGFFRGSVFRPEQYPNRAGLRDRLRTKTARPSIEPLLSCRCACVHTGCWTRTITRDVPGHPFAVGGRFLLTADNHNSVNGIREFALAKGACIDYAPLTVPDLRIDKDR